MFKVHEIEFITYCHATEDCSRVLNALKNLLPPSIRDKTSFTHQTLHGYYGNPITIYSTKIREYAEQLIEYLADQFNESEKAILSATLELRYDRRSNKLYLRVSKQEAYNKKIVLYDSDDVIKIVISFKNGRGLNKVREYLKSMRLIK